MSGSPSADATVAPADAPAPAVASVSLENIVSPVESEKAAKPSTSDKGSPKASETLQSSKHQKWKNQPLGPPPPTNCVVLKNLDYNMTHLQLEEVVRRVTGGRKGFVNISLIEDKTTGSFRGMAFVNFHTIQDATIALSELSKMVINDRKVIAEYRRLKPGERERKEQQEKRAKKFETYSSRQTFEKDVVAQTDAKGKVVDKREAFFAKRDTVRKADQLKRYEEKSERDKERETEFRKLLVNYGEGDYEDGDTVKDLVFDCSLTPYERKMVHTICIELGFGHISRVDDDGNRVLHVTKDPNRTLAWEEETAQIRVESRKQAAELKRKNRENNNQWKKSEPVNGGPLTKEELQGISWFRPRAALAADGDEGAASSGIRAPSYKVYVPERQPKGPDGTIGFASRAANAENGAQPDDTEPGVEGGGTHSDDYVIQNDVKVTLLRKSSGHSVLNPSVPAFSPSSQPSL